MLAKRSRLFKLRLTECFHDHVRRCQVKTSVVTPKVFSVTVTETWAAEQMEHRVWEGEKRGLDQLSTVRLDIIVASVLSLSLSLSGYCH